MAKYTIVAYLLWLLLGWAGAHHFYLRRDRQGLLWLTSVGGVFFTGWFRDFWRIPTYVKDANEDAEYMEKLRITMKHRSSPGIFGNWHRIVGQVMFGVFYRTLIYSALPWESSVMNFAFLVLPLGSAFGTYMVSNVGRQESSFLYSLLGAYIGEFLMGEPHLVLAESNGVYAVCVSMAFSTYGCTFKRTKKHHSFCKRLTVFMAVSLLFWCLLCSFMYFNASVETDEGETIKVRDAIHHFFNSPAWQQIKTSLWIMLMDFYQSWRTGGFEEAWKKFVSLADVEGEDGAYAVLGLEKGASFKEVRSRYRKFAQEWHPDHHQGKGEEEKLKVQKEFMRYRDAYEVLEKIHRRRKKSDDSDQFQFTVEY